MLCVKWVDSVVTVGRGAMGREGRGVNEAAHGPRGSLALDSSIDG